MLIKSIPATKINPAPYNPRVDLKPGDPEYEKLKQSMATFGYVDPLIWNESSGNLVSGHQRFKVLVAEGCKTIQVSVVKLPPIKEKALNLAMNRISGRWDDDRLAQLIKELTETPDLNITLTGFDLPEVTALLDGLSTSAEDSFNFEEDVASIGTPVTKPGDLLCLGRHRILCGDSADPESYRKLLGDAKVNVIHTDPPYNVDYNAGERPAKGARHSNWTKIRHDNLKQPEYEAWLKSVFDCATPYLAAGAAYYIWNGYRQFGPMHRILSELNFNCACVITWAKPSFGLSYADYNPQTEFCLYGWKSKNGAHKWFGPTNETTLWEIGRDSASEYIHPTQKPTGLALRALRNSSVRGDIALDMFLGSGSTLMAAEMLGRTCYGLELEPKYCDAIAHRYLAFTGDTSKTLNKYRKGRAYAK